MSLNIPQSPESKILFMNIDEAGVCRTIMKEATVCKGCKSMHFHFVNRLCLECDDQKQARIP